MKIIFLSDFCRRTASLDICLPRLLGLAGVGLAGAVALAAWVGYTVGERNGRDNQGNAVAEEIQSLLDTERRAIATARADQRNHLDALALKIAELQTHMIRLDALGERLVDVGRLDAGEFDFTAPPPQGGLEYAVPGESQSDLELTGELERLSRQLADREDKLELLEQMLIQRGVLAEVTPSGRPVKKGWMSSAFGKRTDPFSGKKSMHRGLDFAGKRGSEVVAVASGVVTRAEKQSGYGNLVEIRHANGYSTLYAHNQENLVEVGEMVSKGQTIALLGSTGRSSGPHVHFEVHRNGKIENPLRFVKAQ
jgi:murein DD-endopeptidase MepM/ murein hydrolase activator NlpD